MAARKAGESALIASTARAPCTQARSNANIKQRTKCRASIIDHPKPLLKIKLKAPNVAQNWITFDCIDRRIWRCFFNRHQSYKAYKGSSSPLRFVKTERPTQPNLLHCEPC
jgi:TATA-binding protein-associated factor Taf7